MSSGGRQGWSARQPNYIESLQNGSEMSLVEVWELFDNIKLMQKKNVQEKAGTSYFTIRQHMDFPSINFYTTIIAVYTIICLFKCIDNMLSNFH